MSPVNVEHCTVLVVVNIAKGPRPYRIRMARCGAPLGACQHTTANSADCPVTPRPREIAA